MRLYRMLSVLAVSLMTTSSWAQLTPEKKAAVQKEVYTKQCDAAVKLLKAAGEDCAKEYKSVENLKCDGKKPSAKKANELNKACWAKKNAKNPAAADRAAGLSMEERKAKARLRAKSSVSGKSRDCIGFGPDGEEFVNSKVKKFSECSSAVRDEGMKKFCTAGEKKKVAVSFNFGKMKGHKTTIRCK